MGERFEWKRRSKRHTNCHDMEDSIHEDGAHKIAALNADIRELEAALRNEKKQSLSNSQHQQLSAHLLAQSTESLVAAFEDEDEQLDAEFGEQLSYEQQIAAMASLSGISFSKISTDTVE